MAVRIDHLALAAHDARESAQFLADVLGLPDPYEAGPFLAVDVDETFTIDYAALPIDFPGQHVAFLVGEDDFDAIFGRHRVPRPHLLGRPAPALGRAVQHERRRPRPLLRRPRRPLISRSSHAATGPVADVRRAGVEDAARRSGPCSDDFNTEFDTPTPGDEVLAGRLRTLLAGDDLVALLHGDPADGFAVV